MTADQLRQMAITRRGNAGLKIVLKTPEGLTTLYPKDTATKDRWVAQATRKGYTVVES